MILRNHGLVTLGSTIEEAFEYMYNLVLACESQVSNIQYIGGALIFNGHAYRFRHLVVE